MRPQDAEFVELIGAIYDAVIDPNLWERALERLCARFDIGMAGLGVQALPRGSAVIQAAANMPPDYLARLPAYSAEVVEMWGGAAVMAASRGELCIYRMVETAVVLIQAGGRLRRAGDAILFRSCGQLGG